jgi:hypothetical protein
MRSSSRCLSAMSRRPSSTCSIWTPQYFTSCSYELGGPTVYTLEQLVKYCGEVIGRHARIIRLPDALARLQALTFEMAPGEPVISRDNLDSMTVPSVLSGPLAPELGIEPASIETIAPVFLTGASLRSRFNTFRASAGR